jgi:predicted lactoylglutathione lyase
MGVQSLFVNIPVKDLERTKEFWTLVGFAFEPKFTDKNAACMIIGKDLYAMMLTEEFFQSFTKKPIPDPSRGPEAILALSVSGRKEVDALADKALAVGGARANAPYDHGFMYGRSFLDPDSHMWEVFWMDPKGPPSPA